MSAPSPPPPQDGIPAREQAPPSAHSPHPWTHPSGLPNEVRNWALAAHLSAFAGAWMALAFLGPLVVWLMKRDDHPFIAMHAKEALNFNLSVLLYAVVGFLLVFVLVGFLLLPLIGLMWLVLTIIAAIRASNGEPYRYPLTIRLVR
ncbi:MAG: DUF4870 domain-containing protein [Nitriliruptorales bacterium]